MKSLVDVNGVLADQDSRKAVQRFYSGARFLFDRIPQASVFESRGRPPRVLLHYSALTQGDYVQDHRQLAKTGAVLSALFLATVLPYFNISWAFYFFLIAAIPPVIYWMTSRVDEVRKAWEKTEWLDFEARVWRRRLAYADPNHPMPLQQKCISFDHIALVCGASMGEICESYVVSLCETGGDGSGSGTLNDIIEFSNQETGIEFTRALATRWEIRGFFQEGSLELLT